MAGEQSFKNHARIVPIFHVGVFLPLLANVLWTIYRLWQAPSGDAFVALVIAIVLVLGFFSVRTQVLTVQDRVIRLEMQLRLRGVLPAEQASRAERLTVKQLIALRFASDAELPELVDEILGGTLAAPQDIKARIVQWNADHLRA